MPSLYTVNRQSAIEQLKTLGFTDGESVFLRFFYPASDPRKKSDKGFNLTCQFPNLDWVTIEHQQSLGKGCYFVVNGQGHSDAEVSLGRVMFFEHDDLSVDEQKVIWQKLNLPEPTLQIETGGKSVHSYWVFDSPIHFQDWEKLQSDLIHFAQSDKSLKNPSRVMRLAGAYHITPDHKIETTIFSNSNKRYSYEELRGLIPEVKKFKREPKPQSVERYTEDSLVLAALQKIKPDIDYNDGYLDILMAIHSHNPDLMDDVILWQEGHLLEENNHRPGEIPYKWNSFDGNTEGGITIGSLFYHAIEAGYQFPRSLSKEMRDWVTESVKASYPSMGVHRVQKGFGNRSSLVDDLADFCSKAFRKKIEENLTNKRQWTGIKMGLPPDVAKAIETRANLMGVSCELYTLLFLTSMTADLNGKYRVEVNPVSRWYEPLNLWFLVIGDQGTKKSPIFSTVMSALAEKNEQYRDEYEIANRQYEYELAEYNDKANRQARKENGDDSLPPEKPSARYGYMGQGTLEKITLNIRSQQKSFNTGLLLYCDEINTQYSRLTTASGSDDATKFLSAYSGEEVSKDTIKDGYVGVTAASLSIIGGIQPDVYLKLMDRFSSDGQGFSERHLVSEIDHEKLKMIDHTNRELLDSNLTDVTRVYLDKFKDLPKGGLIKMHSECYSTQNVLEQWWFDNKAVNAKPLGQIYRLAGVMACLWNPENPVITLKELHAAWCAVKHSQACKESISGSANASTGELLVDRARQFYLKKGMLQIGTLKSSNSKLFGNLTTEELSEIIYKVHEVSGGELLTNREGNPKLIQDTSQVKAKLEETVKLPSIEPVIAVVEPIKVEVAEVKVEKEEALDVLVKPEVVLVEGEEVQVDLTMLPNSIALLVSDTSEFELVKDNGSRLTLRLKGETQTFQMKKQYVTRLTRTSS